MLSRRDEGAPTTTNNNKDGQTTTKMDKQPIVLVQRFSPFVCWAWQLRGGRIGVTQGRDEDAPTMTPNKKHWV